MGNRRLIGERLGTEHAGMAVKRGTAEYLRLQGRQGLRNPPNGVRATAREG
jgi:hypothetical protein